MKYQTYIQSDQFYMHEDEMSGDSFFPRVPVDMNNALVAKKVGNGLGAFPIQDLQDNIRVRTGDTSSDDYDMDDLPNLNEVTSD